MKVHCFYKQSPKTKPKSDCVMIAYSDSKKADRTHDNQNSSCVFEKDGYVVMICEKARNFSLTAKHYDPAKICLYVVGNKFIPSPSFLGKKYKDIMIIDSKEHPAVCIEVKEGKFSFKDLEQKEKKPKAKKVEKKDDVVDVPKQDKSAKADKST